MEKALQESMRNLHRFQPDFTSILEGFSAYFGNQRASQINENSGRGLERPLEASGRPLRSLWEAFGTHLEAPEAGNRKKHSLPAAPLSVEISTEFDRPNQSRPASRGGGGSSPGLSRIPLGRPQKIRGTSFPASKIASKISLDFGRSGKWG